jgi:hypothetical protein
MSTVGWRGRDELSTDPVDHPGQIRPPTVAGHHRQRTQHLLHTRPAIDHRLRTRSFTNPATITTRTTSATPWHWPPDAARHCRAFRHGATARRAAHPVRASRELNRFICGDDMGAPIWASLRLPASIGGHESRFGFTSGDLGGAAVSWPTGGGATGMCDARRYMPKIDQAGQPRSLGNAVLTTRFGWSNRTPVRSERLR